MVWEERVIGLKPWVVTAAYVGTWLIAAWLLETVFPLGSALWWLGGAVISLLMIAPLLLWLRALYTVASSRLPASAERDEKAQGLFRGAATWAVAYVVLASAVLLLPAEAFLFIAPVALISGYFWLRAIWITTKALLDFEQSDVAFWTFVQIFYFPVGVWFLQHRLQRLLQASPLTAASFA